MTKFEGKVALVTGAASGVGRATSRQMVAQGAKVFGIDINKEGLDLVVDELGANFNMRSRILWKNSTVKTSRKT